MTVGRTLETPGGPLIWDDPLEVLAAVDADLPTAVTDALRRFLDARRETCTALAPEFVDAVDDLADLALGGGKRLRPTFAWWGWRAAGGPTTADAPHPGVVLHAVAALELIQA
jgi:geranylgeranyl diphosphate synthase type I